MSSSVNGLRRVLKFCILVRETFSTLIVWTVINEYGKGAAVYISTVSQPASHVICCSHVNSLLKRDFLDIYLTTFFGVRKLKIHELGGSSFFLKTFKIESKFRKCERKKSQIIFRFWDNSIGKWCYKLYLTSREYLLLALNGLTNSPKI